MTAKNTASQLRSLATCPTGYSTNQLPAKSVGDVVSGRFKLERQLGEGGMGTVFLALDTELKRHVVLKFLRPELAANEQMLQRLSAEAEAGAKLNHKHSVRLLDRGSDYLVMEYIDGPNLLTVLEQERQSGSTLSVERAVVVIRQIGAVLQEAHSHNILHRDIKPSNILIHQDGHAVLADWGLARLVNQPGPTRVNDVCGTTDYMAPELRQRADQASPQSDLYALAATLLHLVTGRSPKVVRESEIPVTLRQPLLQALEDDPSLRQRSVQEFLTQLPQPTQRDSLVFPVVMLVAAACIGIVLRGQESVRVETIRIPPNAHGGHAASDLLPNRVQTTEESSLPAKESQAESTLGRAELPTEKTTPPSRTESTPSPAPIKRPTSNADVKALVDEIENAVELAWKTKLRSDSPTILQQQKDNVSKTELAEITRKIETIEAAEFRNRELGRAYWERSILHQLLGSDTKMAADRQRAAELGFRP